MDVQLVKHRLGNDWVAVTELIGDVLKSDIAILDDTNRSILSHSGKQLRPMLSLLTGRLCSCGRGVNEATIRYAAASELLHNATLLHDDVADSSDCRRGAPTVNALMGPAVSVLVGDYWLVKAVNLILGEASSDTRAVRIFAKTLSDLAQGEMLQLQMASTVRTTVEDYIRIIYSKTASLFEAACLSAAVSVGACKEYEAAVTDYSVSLGYAFQIKDDILDYVGDKKVGKPLGIDILEQKITAPLLGALSNSSESRQEEIRNLVRGIIGHPENREEIVGFVLSNGGIEAAKVMLDGYIDKAVDALAIFPDSEEKALLEELARFVAIRNS